jgi:nucleoside-diphosphate-sugar epimerase
MPRALVLGGTGQVGLATARRLLASGWDVDVTGRNPPRVDFGAARFVRSDRSDADGLRDALGDGADLLVDNVCYTAAQAELLVPLLASVGSTVMLSSKAVYVDAAGNHSNSDVGPCYDGPIRESQPTMAPGDMPYDSREGYGANKVAAEHVFLESGHPVTVIRPSKVHGAGTARPREWMFVKRALDRRQAVFLANRGEGTDHPTAAANIAALVEVAAAKPGTRILNCADSDAPCALEIARIVARLLGHEREEILLDGPPEGNLGRHAWDPQHPIVLDMTAAAELGYEPAGDYAATVTDEVAWLAESQPDWLDDDFFTPLLDYEAENRWLVDRGTV